MHTISIFVDQNRMPKLASYFECQTHLAKNLRNSANFIIRNLRTGLKKAPEFALIDGNRCPALPCTSEFLVKGDAKSASIAAASVLAKVARDRFMLKMAEMYPQYQFEKHKGYGTKLHYEMLDKFGPSPIHRQTFLKTWYAKND